MLRLIDKTKDFFAELKRRNVYKVAITYLAIGWLVCQAAWLLTPALLLPDSFFRAVVVTVGLGFPIALVLAWAFETTPEGVRRTPVADEEREAKWSPAGRAERRSPRRDKRSPPRERRRRQRPPPDRSPSRGRAGRPGARDPGRSQTVKVETPSPGTCEMIPARLEVVGGDPDVDQIRFFDPGGGRDPAFTFGRRSDPSFTHIQLDSPTVSREHAKISFPEGEGEAVIENHSGTNPTQVNGIALEGAGASTELEDGDLIDMGEVRFRYQEL